MAGFQELIRLIVDGELVNAGVTNRAARDLDGNVRYVRDVVEAALMGQTLFFRNQTVDTEVNEGQAVFYNAETQQFEQALASVLTDALTGQLYTAPSTHCWGIVSRKLSADKADILLMGVADINLDDAVEGTVVPGMYFLSGSTPGHLERQQPPVTVPVCLIAGEGTTEGTYQVYVNTNLRDLLDAHKHYRFELKATPSGNTTPPEVGDRHTVTDADPEIEGWLPADHAVFEGKAPAGAAFGYNLSVSALKDLWPPVPVQSSYLEWNKGEDKELLGMGVPLGRDDLCIIDAHGIWWMSDCYDDVPWPTDLDTLTETSESWSALECPRILNMRLILWFTRMVFYTNQTCVLSLTPVAGSGLSITCLGTDDPATTGHLQIDHDLALMINRTDYPGYLVFKAINDKRFDLGPVVEGIKPGSDFVRITPLEGRGIVDEDGYCRGMFEIDLGEPLNGMEFPVETVRLAGAREAFVNNVIALGFDAAKLATFYGRISIRGNLELPTGTQMRLRLMVLARYKTGTSTDVPEDVFTVTVRRLPKPETLNTPVALPLVDTTLPVDCSATITEANQYYEIQTDPFDVVSGDVIMFSVTRQATDDYAGELDIVRKYGMLVVAE